MSGNVARFAQDVANGRVSSARNGSLGRAPGGALPTTIGDAMMRAMPKIGDVVVTMSHPGPFTVVAVNGETLTITTAQGLQKQVLAANVRILEKDEEPATN